MDAVSIASSNRLLEAFERMGVSQGEGLISSGPSPVPDSVARMFEHLMEQSEPSFSEKLPGQPGEAQDVSLAGGYDTPRGNTVTDIPGSESVSPSSVTQAPLLSPTELYRIQFQVAMLRIQSDTGSQVTQKTSQGLDSLLRNQS